MMKRDPILADALSRKSAVKRVAEANNISPSAVCQWRQVPAARVEVTAAVLGLDPELLRAPSQKQSSAA